jgi:hypothetical protein
MRIAISLLLACGSALIACGGSRDADPAGVDAGGADAAEIAQGVEPPPMERIFTRVEAPVDVDGNGMFDDVDTNGVPVTEILFYFDIEAFEELCVVPDADSFDDYENVDLGIPRGVTPVSVDCRRDGIITGPMHEELYPSKWCRIRDCVRHGSD